MHLKYSNGGSHRLQEVALPERIIDRHTGGNTTYARSIAKGLRDRGIVVSHICAGRNAPLTAVRETAEGLKTPFPGKVLHYSADTGPLIRTRTPSVLTVHGVASRWISTARNARQEWVWRQRVEKAIGATDQIITVSKSSANDVSAVFDVAPDRITTIHHGIDFSHFATPQELPPSLAHLRGRPYALYLGNIEPRKNLIELIEAFKQPRIANLGVQLIIAGRPAWNSEKIMAAIEAGPVKYLGLVSDQERVALMQHAEIFVFPSLYEGFGFPVLEAMAAGTPVLTSDRGSLAEVAGPAISIKDTSRDGIAEGLLMVLQESERDLERFVSEGKEWAAQFSWDASVEAHLAVYRKALAR